MTVEGNTQHGNSQQEGNILTFLVFVLIGLTNRPNGNTDEQNDIDNLTGVKRTTEDVDEQQLEPSTHLNNAGNDTIKHGGEDDDRDKQGNK